MPRGKRKVKQTDNFTLSLEVEGKKYIAFGTTIQDALLKLRVPAKSKGVLVITKDGKSKEFYIPMPKMMRLFTFPDSTTAKIAQGVAAKTWETIFRL